MSNYLRVIIERVEGFIQAQSVYYSIYGGHRFWLKFELAPTLTQTLQNVRERIREHYALMQERKIESWIKGYELHLSILGENLLFFDTAGNELDDDINTLPYRNFSFETLYTNATSFFTPKLPPNAKRAYIPRVNDFRKWRASGVEMGVVSAFLDTNSPQINAKADKALRMLLKANEKLSHILVNGRLSKANHTSYLIYALDNALDLRELLYELGVKFSQKFTLYSDNGAEFERLYMSKINVNEMPFKANLWLENGNFCVKNYERFMGHFYGNFKVLQFSDGFAKGKVWFERAILWEL